MSDNSIFRCIIAVLCLAVMTGCSEKSSSDVEAEPATSQITTVATTEITTTVTNTATAETTTVITTTTAAAATEKEGKMLDRIADSLDEPSELTSPFGDISNAYVCFGGTALYPSVRVLSADEVRKLSKVLNSMEWTEFPDKPETPYTPGPSDLTLYVNDNGKCSHLDLIGDTYRDENGYRYFMTKSPAAVEGSFTIYQICDDLLFNSDLKDVSTHLFMLHDICQPDGSYNINDYWDLIWDDIIPFIEDQENKDDNNE